VTKKPRIEDEEEQLFIILKRFRKNWMESFSEFYGPFEATSTYTCIFSFYCPSALCDPPHSPSIWFHRSFKIFTKIGRIC
jgi:hypothetical protein